MQMGGTKCLLPSPLLVSQNACLNECLLWIFRVTIHSVFFSSKWSSTPFKKKKKTADIKNVIKNCIQTCNLACQKRSGSECHHPSWTISGHIPLTLRGYSADPQTWWPAEWWCCHATTPMTNYMVIMTYLNRLLYVNNVCKQAIRDPWGSQWPNIVMTMLLNEADVYLLALVVLILPICSPIHWTPNKLGLGQSSSLVIVPW